MQTRESLPLGKTPVFSSPRLGSCLFGNLLLAALLAWTAWAFGDLWYSETQGPFKNLTQVVDPDVFAAGNSYHYQVWLNDGKGGFK